MSRFVQVLGPADGGGMTLDHQRLRQMLCDEAVKNLPVIVLAVVGPRGAGKTRLLTAVQRAIAGSGDQSAGMGPGMQSFGMGPVTQATGMGTVKVGQVHGMGFGSQPVGMGFGAQSVEVGSDALLVDIGPEMSSNGTGSGMQSTGMGPAAQLSGVQSHGMGPGMYPAGMEPGAHPFAMGQRAQLGGAGPMTNPAGMGFGAPPFGMGHETQSAVATPTPALATPGQTACEADRPGSAGAAVWPHLLQVTLSSGERAALLLVDTWGPFDDTCPAQQRAAVLLFSALLSSTLTVLTSAGEPVCPLEDLAVLARLGAAAEDVQHCTALQELLLLVRDWRGPAPPGRQTGFQPLRDWSQSGPAARTALAMMMEAADWFSEDGVLLFLVQDSATRAAVPADSVGLLAASRAVKKFDEANVTAGELADCLERLAAVLALPQCDAVSLLRALVEANHRMAVETAMSVYMGKLGHAGNETLLGSVTERELRGAHDRAAHDALIAFTMSRKMDSKDVNLDKLKKELQDWMEKQYESKLQANVASNKNLKDKSAEQCRICKDAYEIWMQDALNQSPLMTMAELIKNHDKCRLEALSVFDKSHCSLSQQRMILSDDLEQLFRKFASKLDQAREDAKADQAEKSLVLSAQKSSELLYSSIMDVVQPDKLSSIHVRVQECAILHFDSKTKTLSDESKSSARTQLQDRNSAYLDHLKQRRSYAHQNFDSTMVSPQAAKYNSGGRGRDDRGLEYQYGQGNATAHSRETREKRPWYRGVF